MSNINNKEMKAVFDEFDLDNSGKIDVIEMKNALEKLFGRSEMIDNILAEMMIKLGDKDGDNLLDFDEFQNWCEKMM